MLRLVKIFSEDNLCFPLCSRCDHLSWDAILTYSPTTFYVRSDATQSLKNNNKIKKRQRWKEQCLHISAEKTGHLSRLYAEWQPFFFPLQSSSLFYHVQFITSCLISSPLPAHETCGSIYRWCNIYTYTCWTYSPHTSDRLIFARVKSSHGSSRLHQKKCWHVLQAVFPALYMADQPWMSCLTGPAAARCV